jgi:hypothetical protein
VYVCFHCQQQTEVKGGTVSPIEDPIPVHDSSGELVGEVIYDSTAQKAKLAGRLYIPREYHLNVDDGEVSVKVSYEVRGGVPVCTDIQITGEQVMPKKLAEIGRKLPAWNELAQRAVMSVSYEFPGLGGARLVASPGSIAVPDVERRAAEKEIGKRRKKVNDDLLREVAATYKQHVDSGSVTAVIAARFDVGERTASNYIWSARKAGFLPATKQGARKA